MKLIISEKPSTARTIAHAVGAREKVYGEGKEYCYKGNDFYVVNARGHLYGLGMPQDYGFGKAYKMEELPMFPTFQLFPEGDDTENLRNLISSLINRSDVDELICATDAGREGELIFRHIYNANKCSKPVKRLWTNSMTDEAIRKCMANLPPDSDFDGEYYAALAREQSDWIIGMNLSRLYGIKDNYTHRIGRVKTPVLAIIVDRDNEIDRFEKKTTYRLEMGNGAVSEMEYGTREEAEYARVKCSGKSVNVLSAVSEEKHINRPLLHSLTTLQQEANRVYGLTAKQTLEAAQSLYENKLITYPRTDCNYVSEDMRGQIIRVVSTIGERPEYADRAHGLIGAKLNLDGRVINDKAMNGHDHHAIIPEASTASLENLTDTEREVYGLIVNRLLCAVDKPFSYTETNYEFWCEDIAFTLKTEVPTEIGWKQYDTEKTKSDNADVPKYAEGSTFDMIDISVKECAAKPPKHFTDASLLSVMNNIDNRIDDKELKAAVSGKGIGTEATRADIIEQLISAKYAERRDKNIISTEFGRAFIASIPDNVKSSRRTAEWEQVFTNIMEKGISAEPFMEDVKEFVRSVISYENSPGRHRTPVKAPDSGKRTVTGICPRCGKNIYEGKQSYYCESGKEGCGFTLWKEPKFFKDVITPEKAARLIEGKTVSLKAESKDGKIYSADYKMDDTGKYVNLERIQVKDRVKDEYGNEVRDQNGKYILVINDEETKAARRCANIIKAEFQDWIFKDPERREALVQTYNEMYNSIRPREYDGSHL
ncbi:MAG: DNA topoisomerase, partial [Oscillospiraceae bacterium]